MLTGADPQASSQALQIIAPQNKHQAVRQAGIPINSHCSPRQNPSLHPVELSADGSIQMERENRVCSTHNVEGEFSSFAAWLLDSTQGADLSQPL